jgi:hypothetical protein
MHRQCAMATAAVHADKGYDSRANRAYLRHRGIRPWIVRRGTESSTRAWAAPLAGRAVTVVAELLGQLRLQAGSDLLGAEPSTTAMLNTQPMPASPGGVVADRKTRACQDPAAG